MPLGLFRLVLTATVLSTVFMAAGFIMTLKTNRQSWQVMTALSVIPMNAALIEVNRQLLSEVLPRVCKVATKSEDRVAMSLAAHARIASFLMIICNVAFCAIFPPVCAIKLAYGIHSRRLVPSVELDSWIVAARPPVLSQMPQVTPDVMPIPVLEVLEICMGWMILVACVLTSTGYPVGKEEPDAAFLDCEFIGQDLCKRVARGASHPNSERLKIQQAVRCGA
jgi:hypothetical protein